MMLRRDRVVAVACLLGAMSVGCGEVGRGAGIDVEIDVEITADVAIDSEVDSEADAAGEVGADVSGDVGEDVGDAVSEVVAPCAPGTTVSAIAGGAVRLELCGGTLTGSAPAGTAVTLTVVAAPQPLPYEHALIGVAYEVAGADFFGQLAIADSGEPPGYRLAALHDAAQGWLGFEACPAQDGLSFPVGPGIYALLRDINIYPASPQAIGSGTVTSRFMGEDIAWTFDDGYAIHDVGADGLRSVTLIVRRTPSEGILQQLDVRLVEAADHRFSVLQVSLLDTSDLSGGWAWLEPVDGPLSTATIASEAAAGPIVGSFDAPLHKGDAVEMMHVELAIETGRYRYPPEGACFPEG